MNGKGKLPPRPMEIVYLEKIPSLESTKLLYEDAGWDAYTKDMDKLMLGLTQSLFVVSAWDENRLVGLIRCIGDSETILYIQDILVLKDYQRQGIGRKLIQLTLDHYPFVRQKILVTEDSEQTRNFYESLGFESYDQGKLVAFGQ